MATTKLPDSILLTIDLISWAAIVFVMGMILTLIGGSIYASLVIAHCIAHLVSIVNTALPAVSLFPFISLTSVDLFNDR
jgi:hypothetical protein